MGLLDWVILGVCLCGLMGFALWTKRYNKSVADFLAANRCGGRYLMATAQGMVMLGAISFIAEFERVYVSGLGPHFWGAVLWPLSTIVAVSGWLIYRFRQTEALTLAQFLETRYNRKVRILAGSLCFIAGITNFGIFPGIGCKFFVYFCNLPEQLSFLGLQIPTFIPLMVLLLTISAAITLWGGQIAVLVTDFAQGAFTYIVLILITVVVLCKFNWTVISEALLARPAGAGGSFVNPFDIGELPFDYIFIAITIFYTFYAWLSWQSNQAYNSSAKDPHEARMSKIIGVFRGSTLYILIFIALCAYTVMNHASFSSTAAEVNASLSEISNETLKTQMTTPVFIGKVLPVGFLGLFCTVVFFAFITTHDTFLHILGSILVQDIVVPLRKKPLTNKGHMKLLKWSVIGVAVFAFFWSSLLNFGEHIIMYWMITSTIFVSGAGAALIGGLYWKRGTSSGAFSALVVGATLTIIGFVIRAINPDFQIRAPHIALYASFISIFVYVSVSLLTRTKEPFNMDKMLHRGKYATESEREKKRSSIGLKRRWFGITHEFTKADIVIYILSICFTFGISIISIGFAIVYFFANKLGFTFGDEHWGVFWKYLIYLMLGVATVASVWYIVGGIIDVRKLFKDLNKIERNDLDDGRVVAGHNLADEATSTETNDSVENT